MFIFGSVWDYLLYNTITSNPLGLLYVIALVGYYGADNVCTIRRRK